MKTIIASTVTFLTLFVFGGIWNIALMGDFYASQSPSIVRPIEDFNFGIILVTNLINVGLIYLFGTFYFEKFSGKAFLFGAFLGLILVQPGLTNLYAKWNFSFSYLLADTVYTMLEIGLGMTMFCWLYFRGKESAVRAQTTESLG